MKNLFYSKSEQLLFWITRDNSNNVSELINLFSYGAQKLAGLTCGGSGLISTFQVNKSLTHRNKRVFYAKTGIIPKGAHCLAKKWTMMKWIEN